MYLLRRFFCVIFAVRTHKVLFAMTNTSAELNTIERPRLWRLALQIDSEALRAVVWSTVEEPSLRHFTMPLDPTLPLHKAVEETVYSTPLLLSDFGGIDVVVRTRAFTLVPDGFDRELQRKLMHYCQIDDDSQAQYVQNIAGADASVLWTLDEKTAGFVARTFRNPAMHCHITPLVRFFGRQALLGNRGKLFAHLHGKGEGRQVDIVAFDRFGRLAMAATHPTPALEDMLYYILASARHADLDLSNDEIQLCGSAATRDALMPRLRTYASYVMPMIFPSAALRNGREALEAPLPLILLPLCE